MVRITTFAVFASLLFLSFSTYASVRQLNIGNEGIVGNFYTQVPDSRQVGVLVLGGSGGGIPDKLATPIAEAGYPTLALAYFDAEGLPPELERIPLDYFSRAKAWLQSQPNVTSGSLIVVGWSKGAELALLLAARDATISRVVAIAPSSVVWAGILKDWTKTPGSSWTMNGEELAYVPFRPSGEVKGLNDLYSQSLANRSDNGKADIPVENIQGQVTLMTGENDEIWPSPQMAETVCQTINAATTGQCEHLNYDGLGHLLDYVFLEKGSPMHTTFMRKLKGTDEAR